LKILPLKEFVGFILQTNLLSSRMFGSHAFICYWKPHLLTQFDCAEEELDPIKSENVRLTIVPKLVLVILLEILSFNLFND